VVNEKIERMRVQKGRNYPSPVFLKCVPLIFLADPGRVLPPSQLWFQLDKKITLKASIREGITVTEIKVSFHPLQRASDI